jgi:nitrite reductase/ring-hydroxylating ferredoxin subunit
VGTRFRDVGAVDDFPVGKLRRADIPGKDICILRAPDGSWRAIKNTCPHQGGPLCDGDVDWTFLPSNPGTYEAGMEYRIIRCPYHGYEYSLDTGLPEFGFVTGERVVLYPVKIEDGRVLVSEKAMLPIGTRAAKEA